MQVFSIHFRGIEKVKTYKKPKNDNNVASQKKHKSIANWVAIDVIFYEKYYYDKFLFYF